MKKSIDGNIWRAGLQVVGLSLLFSFGIRTFVAEARSIPSGSMEPKTLQVNFQPQSAETFHPGFWQPVARVNPDRPVKLVVVNESNLPLEYGLTTGATYSAGPESEEVLNSISAPASVLIYSPAANSSLRYNVSSNNNTVWVRVRASGRDMPGNDSLDIARSGAIYTD